MGDAMKILIAEDDKHTREGLVDILEGEGYETLAAEDGKQALALFTKEHPDLVCLDVMMPGLDGYEVCKEIRRFDKQVPVIFLTAKSQEREVKKGLSLGAIGYLIKPFNPMTLAEEIQQILLTEQETPS